MNSDGMAKVFSLQARVEDGVHGLPVTGIIDRRPFMTRVWIRALLVCLAAAWSAPARPEVAREIPFAAWRAETDGRSTVEVSAHRERPDGLELRYSIPPPPGYVQVVASWSFAPTEETPFVFRLKAQSSAGLEVKFEDADGSVFGRRIPLENRYGDWTEIVLYRNNLEYWWGGKDETFDAPARLSFAVSGTGAGTVALDGIGRGRPGMAATFPPAGPVLDPDRHLEGIGFRQRRAAGLIPEDPLVLEWLKREQDVSSPEGHLLRTMEGDISHTFNNALVAMAFLLKGETARAQRILDFYARATVRESATPGLQNFFFQGEPRGFYQAVRLRPSGQTPAYYEPGGSDRWMGDMAWLLLACKYHERKVGRERYQLLASLLEDLLVSYYKDAGDGLGGYVQHGWRGGDKRLHEASGHPEGNIDCYAALQVCGRREMAANIRRWLDRALARRDLPLDLYSWRVLAFGRDSAPLLDIPEHDLRYRKSVLIGERKACGFYDHPDIAAENVWLDGTGHMACAYRAVGDRQRGDFYANQMDAFILPKQVGGTLVHALPYTANRSAGYEWVDPHAGFVSVGAWYLFAKSGFNPMALE